MTYGGFGWQWFCCCLFIVLMLPLFVGVLFTCFVIQYLCLEKFCNHPAGEERASCFNFKVFCHVFVVVLCLFLTVPWVGL